MESKHSKTVLRVRENTHNGTWFIQSKSKDSPGWSLFSETQFKFQTVAEDLVNWHIESFPNRYEREE